MKSLYALPILVATMILTACASIGRPDGGARDEQPPVYVRSNPAPGALNVDGRNITIVFNENVQLEDAFNKVVISPVQLEAPQISANGRNVRVQIRDTMKANTTYTIDFADAIKDLNEGNVLDGFALDFSTGESIDTMRVSGMVLGASNLEPAQGVLVAAYSNLSDTAIRTLPPDRIARTNQYGMFTIRNLAPGTYRVYMLNDINRDWHWDRSEDVAYLDELIVPSTEAITVTDTLYSSTGGDSLVTRPGTMFLPNDILLNWFNEDYKAQYIKEYKRPERRKVNIEFGAPSDSMPEIRIVDGPTDESLRGLTSDHWATTVASLTKDTIDVWLSDTMVINTDSLRLSVRYQKPDSLERMVWTTDTLRFYFKNPRRSKKEIEADTLPPRYDLLKFDLQLNGGVQEVYSPLKFKVDQPLVSLDTSAVRLEHQVDTLWMPINGWNIVPDSLNPVFTSVISTEWIPGDKYRLSVDSAAVVSIYGEHNRPVSSEFNVRSLSDYSNLDFVLQGADSTTIVQLLNTSDEPVAEQRVVDGRAKFKYLAPAVYYARVFFDTNGDGKWTTGKLDSIQPEEVAYYPSKIELKRNWDVEQQWNIYETPLDRQKPYALLKNKPKLKRGERDPREEIKNEDEEDEFMGGGFGNRNNNSNSNKGSGGRRGVGGLKPASNNNLRR
ncbi:MAG: Ig-like domain-containing protein [Muribaculaceae bacterium]